MPGTDAVHFGEPDESEEQIFSTRRQGDVIEQYSEIQVVGADGLVAVSCPHGVAVISQTCDVVRDTRRAIHVARVITLDEHHARESRDGKRPRYVHLPSRGLDKFADLEFIATVGKQALLGHQFLRGLGTDDEVRRFSAAVARKFGRFAFPDEVTPWLHPLEQAVSSKSRKGSSPEGQILNDVVEFRIEAAGGWGQPPFDLTLCVIVEPGVLPDFTEPVPAMSGPLAQYLYSGTGDLRRGASEIAGRLATTTISQDRYWLWMALGEAWAARCKPPSSAGSEVHSAVSTIEAEVVPSDEFPLSRVRRSEILDLDHLSG